MQNNGIKMKTFKENVPFYDVHIDSGKGQWISILFMSQLVLLKGINKCNNSFLWREEISNFIINIAKGRLHIYNLCFLD